MSDTQPAAVPFHFGTEGELFGFFHAGRGSPRAAVLLCPPFGQDLIRSHRGYRQLAESLGAKGVASLRFDYYGSGDSMGDSTELSWTRCMDNILTAAAELRARSGFDQIIGFGARLGGNLVLATAMDARFSAAIVWDPILDGAHHVARLDAMQEKLRVDSTRFTRPRSPADVAGQWLGFPISLKLREALGTLQLSAPALPTLLLDSCPASFPRGLEQLIAAGVSVKTLNARTAWDELDRLEHAILSPELIRIVTDHLSAAA